MKPFTNKILLMGSFLLSLLQLISCKKFVQVDVPGTALNTVEVFSSDAGARAAMMGIYSRLSQSGFASGDLSSVSYLAGLSADELQLVSTEQEPTEFANNGLTANNARVSTLWSQPYQIIYAVNSLLEGVAKSEGMTASVKKEISGEAKFVRAFCHLYLVTLFGDIPYATTTDYEVNNLLTRMPAAVVLEDIIADLEDAVKWLPSDYSLSAGEHTLPIQWTAEALLARAELYAGQWGDAVVTSTSVIDDGGYQLETDLSKVFLNTSTEAIWQLKPVVPNANTNDGISFIITDNPSNSVLHPQLLDAFETNDQRRMAWVGSIVSEGTTYYFPYKYKVKFSDDLTEYSMVLRLAEQYLIRAEALAHLQQYSLAVHDLNTIRTRAGLPPVHYVTEEQLLADILHERQVELFTEWGHRWIDLKRTGTADSVLSIMKQGWEITDQLYPIPAEQILNGKDFSQNPGY